jgi:probable F420-dependent oxidoreductase
LPPRAPIELSVMAAAATSATEWTGVARFAERAGFGALLVSDHVHDQLGPIAAILKAAEATERLRVGSLVFNLDHRNPVLLAKEAATIDLFSDGRFELGVGAGWDRGEYDAAGLEYASPRIRIARLREGVTVLRRLFGDGPVTFEGEHYRVAALEGMPKPAAGSAIPILVGGGGRQVLALAAELADVVGLNVKFTADGVPEPASLTAEAVARRMSWIAEVAGRHGRRPAVHVLVQGTCVTDRRNSAADAIAARWRLSREELFDSPYFLVGTPDQIAADLVRHARMFGISRWTVSQPDMAAIAPVLERLPGPDDAVSGTSPVPRATPAAARPA